MAADGTDEHPSPQGVVVRIGISLVALVVGLVWIVQLTFEGSSLGGGLLFDLLAPLVLLYFAISYLSSQYDNLRHYR